MVDDTRKTETIQSVALAFHILEALAEEKAGLGVTALATKLGTSKSRVHRHLRSLVNMGYIRQSPITERYTFGSRLIALGRAAAGQTDLVSVAQPFVRDLRDATGLAVSIGQVEDDGVRILSTVPGTHQIDVAVRAGSLLDHFKSAQGFVALAFMPAPRREAIFGRHAQMNASFDPEQQADFERRLEQVAAAGWADAPNVAMRGLNALACPILGDEGSVLGTIALVSLTEHIPTPPGVDQITAIQSAAQAISEALGRPSF